MIFKNIKIKGFKGIDSEVSIPLAPITLLFGANSSGKSTILQAFMYLYEVICNRNMDPYLSSKQPGGSSFNGFVNLVHGKKIDGVISIEIEMDVSNLILESYLSKSDEFFINDRLPYALLNEPAVDRVSLRFDIAYDPIAGVYVKHYTSFIEGEEFSSLSKQPLSPEIKFHCHFEGRDDVDEIYGETDLKQSLLDGLGGGRNPVLLDRLNMALPDYRERLQIADSEWVGDSDSGSGSDPIAGKLYAEAVLSQLTVAPLKILADELEKLIHIGPIRKVPCRGYSPSQVPVDWYGGIAAWDLFAFSEGRLQNRVNEIFGSDGFDSKYKFVTSGENKNIKVKDTGLDVDHEPAELGIGISQVFPFVVAAADSSQTLVSIEQPELHIHPKWQLVLGDLLIAAIKDDPNRMFFVETHSEQLMLRLLKRVRLNELQGNDVAPALAVSPDKISVVCVYPHDGKPFYQRQQITSDGDFELDWPEGFFEERYGEI